MSKTPVSAAEKAPSQPHTDPGLESSAAPDAAVGAAAGAAAGVGLWGLAMPAVNLLGFTTSGIAGGSTAASMMSAAAVANGGGVASGGAVAIMQSIGAVGLATPIGLGLVAGAAAIGGAALLVKSRLSSAVTPKEAAESADPEADDEEKGLWVLVEISPDSGKPSIRSFDDDYRARNAFLNSPATSKALFDPEHKTALELGWDQSMNGLVGAARE
ncbi:hypothetical protein PHYPSEUDO_004106 [Phytophthora pseudosyringae]|uniref:Uncharacterized protein n=1 Tax=Phytophthora pseudosyringae TaxID=221518 RepID=A0A8T1WGZ6_9STRA|nr:hypothetical protein PHYPSEUDO_004106 [Phytophthora pseudosyringae]